MTQGGTNPSAASQSAVEGRKVSALSPAAAAEIEIKQKESDARRSIAMKLVYAYVAVLTLSVLVPVGLYVLGTSGAEEGDRREAVREISAPLAAGLTSLTGVLGFVLGYYFKSAERMSESG